MDNSLLDRCEKLIVERMGLHVRQQDAELLHKTLLKRVAALKLTREDDYLALLQSPGAAGETEWKQLFSLLTNQESYFFRDQGQFYLLRHQIVPELIERNRKKQTLRVWSAGCSTGEEPYSLAILIDLLLPFRAGWKVTVLGTDLSEGALEKAQLAHYGAWSFRALEPELQQRYFHKRGNRFELDARIRNAVTFGHGNLLQDRFPTPGGEIHDLDLILCRNVFIYFKRDAVASIIQKFDKSLAPGGYLLTGHAELHDVALGDLRPLSFPQTLIYRKEIGAARKPGEAQNAAQPPLAPPAVVSAPPTTPNPELRPVSPAPKAPPSLEIDEERLIKEAVARLRAGNSPSALSLLAPLLRAEKRHFAAHCLAAQAHANAGRHEEALEQCRQATQADVFAPLPYLIRARIADEQGQVEDAKTLLKKVIYLAPAIAMPYVELAAIYAREGDAARAKKMRATALELLAGLQPSDAVPAAPLVTEAEISVEELRAHLGQN